MKQFLRRFIIVYLGLYCLPFPIGALPWTDSWQDKYSDFLNAGAAWLGQNVLGLRPVFTGFTGSGDTPAKYIVVGCFIFLAMIIALLWGALRRRNEDSLHLWIYHYVRLTLAAALFAYGWAKIIPPGQFGSLTPGRLLESYGDSSPMGLMWTFMGASRPYTFFAGLMEVVAGCLLFIPQLVTAGALLSSAVMANVFLLNMCYDVPVKLYSFHLLLLSTFLLVPDITRMLRFFVLNFPVEPRILPRLFQRRGAERAFLIAQVVLAFCIGFASIHSEIENGDWYFAAIQKIQLFGVWKVRDFALEPGKREPNSVSGRWTRVVFDFRDRVMVRTTEGHWLRFQAKYDYDNNSLSMHGMDELTSTSDLKFERPTNDMLTMKGSVDSKKISMRLEKEADLKFPLVTRGFHWTTEIPFNR